MTLSKLRWRFGIVRGLLCWWVLSNFCSGQDLLSVRLDQQFPTGEGKRTFHRVFNEEHWKPNETALIICDMWDSHHCVNAVRRVGELAPRIDYFAKQLRDRGVVVIHAPSSCMGFYEASGARRRAQSIPKSKEFPDAIDTWCDRIPSEEAAAYPLDQSAGGEDDDPNEHSLWASKLAEVGRNPKAPWIRQTQEIAIDDERDYISDDGKQIWSILQHHRIQNALLVGVHTNMCVLGRPFGLRRLASNGIHVALVRDLTDTMYDPNAWPYVSHFSGTDLIVDHVERYVCPSTLSASLIGGSPFRFSGDKRARLGILIGEDEYKTEATIPVFANVHLRQRFSVEFVFDSEKDKNLFPGVERLADMDALLVSVRRRTMKQSDLEMIQRFVKSGKPVIGIRTASHAFSLKNQVPAVGHGVWPELDREVWGGNYQGHYANDQKSQLGINKENQTHPLMKLGNWSTIKVTGTLYKTAPLAKGTTVFLEGAVDSESFQPVAWSHIRADGGRSFYTSLGHVDEFAQPAFAAFLSAAIHWICDQPIPSEDESTMRIERYASGRGKQRK